MNLFDLLANDPNLAAGFKRIFQVAAAQMPEGASPRAEDSSTSQHSSGAAASFQKPKPDGTDWDQLAQEDRDTFDARLDSMPEPLGGDDE